MSSIRQNAGHPLPDWRNLGVLLRVLVGVNVLALGGVLARVGGLDAWLAEFVAAAAWVEPLLLGNLGLLVLARDLLWRCPVRLGQALVLLLAGGSTALFWDAWRFLGLVPGGWSELGRAVLLALCVAGVLLGYFELRARAFSPRVEEAQLQALNARIRPHFLFNALNTVIALIRTDPRRAETALEELAELFRALLREPRELVALSDEIALGRHYLDLEKLRLGDRLQVVWEVNAVPLDTRVPPLMLQPLLENAVLHGIEPAPAPGVVRVTLNRKGELLQLVVRNPCHAGPTAVKPRQGQHMALDNIRARLALYYDMEARLEHGPVGTDYEVRIELPCRHSRTTQ
ncbi:MAG: histidine kinase [Azovibrio sp.]|nr:histidine kinase [Azovibrio sp.]